MKTEKEFLVVNCLSQGFAVAGPSSQPGADLELVLWGVSPEAAHVLADDLNAPPKTKPAQA